MQIMGFCIRELLFSGYCMQNSPFCIQYPDLQIHQLVLDSFVLAADHDVLVVGEAGTGGDQMSAATE